MNEDSELDAYGNPTDGSRLIHCCFPDCGCDGSRLCMAENGASERAMRQNVEGMWSNGSKLKCRRAVFDLVGSVAKEQKDKAREKGRAE